MKKAFLFVLAAAAAILVSCEKEPAPKKIDNKIVTPEAVDIGIKVNGKSVLWANFNLGAKNEFEYGNYYAWGETVVKKKGYSWKTYAFSDPLGTKFSKYCLIGMGSWCGNPEGPDDTSQLLLSDDVAAKSLGAGWRMPTDAEILQLLYTQKIPTYKWETNVEAVDASGNPVKDAYGNVIRGTRITFTVNGKSIFLPAAGRISGKGRQYVGDRGYYWSSTLSGGATGGPDGGWQLGFDTGGEPGHWSNSRYLGCTVRPVFVAN